MESKIIRESRGIIPIPEMFERIAQEHPDIPALQMRKEYGWERYTYSELYTIVKMLAKGLTETFGLRKGDHVAIRGSNCPEWIISALAVHWFGGVVVPIDARLSESEAVHILRLSDSKLIITDSPSEEFAKVCSQVEFDEIKDYYKSPGMEREKSLTLEDLAVLFFTSGTTGNSKGVMLSHRNIMSNVDQVYMILEFYPGDNQFLILPLHHVFPYTVGFILSITSGLILTIARSFKSNELKQDMLATKPLIVLAVPLLLEKIVQGIERELKKQKVLKKGIIGLFSAIASPLTKRNIRGLSKNVFKAIREALGMDHLRYLVSGGAALPEWVSRRLEIWGFPLLQGYGLTETSPVVSVNPPERPKNTSIGLPLPGVDVKLIDEIEGVGELVVRGPNVMVGYYKNPKATREVLSEDGWFRTGDLGYIDDEGYIYITGRAKSVIVTRGGKNIYPEEIEEKIGESPFVEEVLVLMEKNANTGLDELVAHIYPNFEAVDEYCQKKGEIPCEGSMYDILMGEIKRVNGKMAAYKRIRRIVIREEEFPKTSTKKIKRYLFIQKGREVE